MKNILFELNDLIRKIGGIKELMRDPQYESHRSLCESELLFWASSGNLDTKVASAYIVICVSILRHMMINIQSMNEPNSNVEISEHKDYRIYYTPNDYIMAYFPEHINCRYVMLQCVKILYKLGYPSVVKSIHNNIIMYMQTTHGQGFICNAMVTFSKSIGQYFTEPPLFEFPYIVIEDKTNSIIQTKTPFIEIPICNSKKKYGCCNCGLLPIVSNDSIELNIVCCKPLGLKCNFKIKLE